MSWYADRFKTEEMFRDLKDRLHMKRHHLGTEAGVGTMMLLVALGCPVILGDGNQWRSRTAPRRIMTSAGTHHLWDRGNLLRLSVVRGP